MRHLFFSSLVLLSANVMAQTTTPTADSWEMRQRNEANTGIYVYYIVPDGAVDQIPTYNGSTNKPEYSKLGTGLSRTGTTLNVSLSASQITGTTATGQALMTAVDSAAARTAIGVSSPPPRSFSYQTRTLNTCFQVSSTRDALVSYSVDIATSLSLTAGQQGTVYLRTYSNSSCTTGAQELTRFVNGQTGTLTIGLALTQNVTGTLTGVVPAGAYVQLVTENNTGTPTFTARPGQEVLL